MISVTSPIFPSRQLTANSYIAGAIYQLKYFIQQYGDDAVKEINEIAHAHSIILDFDEEKKLGSYNGVEIADGRIRIGFAPQCLGTNVDYAIDQTKFAKALNDAPPAPGTSAPMSYLARTDIRIEYDEKIEETRKKIADMLERPDIKLVPNFEEAFAKMTEAKAKDKKKELRDDWQQNLGNYVRRYWEGLAYQAEYQKFGEVGFPFSPPGAANTTWVFARIVSADICVCPFRTRCCATASTRPWSRASSASASWTS